jgi:hypothetical protein
LITGYDYLKAGVVHMLEADGITNIDKTGSAE